MKLPSASSLALPAKWASKSSIDLHAADAARGRTISPMKQETSDST
jgi:hypothetical protein